MARRLRVAGWGTIIRGLCCLRRVVRERVPKTCVGRLAIRAPFYRRSTGTGQRAATNDRYRSSRPHDSRKGHEGETFVRHASHVKPTRITCAYKPGFDAGISRRDLCARLYGEYPVVLAIAAVLYYELLRGKNAFQIE